MTVQNGDPLPKANFTVMTQDGPEARTTDQIFQGRKVVLFGVQTAFARFSRQLARAWIRSQRYAMLVDNGVVRKFNVETAAGKVETSSAEALLKQL